METIRDAPIGKSSARLLQVIEGFCDTIGKARNRKRGTT